MGCEDSTAIATPGTGNKTFTAGNDEKHSVDSCSLKDQLTKMESLLTDKLGKLDGKMGASESNLSAQITRQFNTLCEVKYYLSRRRMATSKQK